MLARSIKIRWWVLHVKYKNRSDLPGLLLQHLLAPLLASPYSAWDQLLILGTDYACLGSQASSHFQASVSAQNIKSTARCVKYSQFSADGTPAGSTPFHAIQPERRHTGLLQTAENQPMNTTQTPRKDRGHHQNHTTPSKGIAETCSQMHCLRKIVRKTITMHSWVKLPRPGGIGNLYRTPQT